MSHIWNFLIATLVLAALPIAVMGQDNADPSNAALPDCPARYRILNEPVGDPFDCMCTPEIARTMGTVKLYGSGPYDSVSNVCLAAIHAGVTDQDGGPIRLVPRPPQSSFEGSIENGIASEPWGSSLFNTYDVVPVD